MQAALCRSVGVRGKVFVDKLTGLGTVAIPSDKPSALADANLSQNLRGHADRVEEDTPNLRAFRSAAAGPIGAQFRRLD